MNDLDWPKRILRKNRFTEPTKNVNEDRPILSAAEIYGFTFVDIFLAGSIIFFYSARVTLRPFKVIDFGANRKRICDFLLVRHSNFGPILHCFRDIAGFLCSCPHPYSSLILWMFPLHQIAHVGVNLSRHLKLFSRKRIFEVHVFQPTVS